MDSSQQVAPEHRAKISRCAKGFVGSLAERLDRKGYLRYKDLSLAGTFAPSRIMTAEQFEKTYPGEGELTDRLGLWVGFDWTTTRYRLVVLVSALAGHHDLSLFASTRLVSGSRNLELTPPRRAFRIRPSGEGPSIDEDWRDPVIGNIVRALRDYRSEYRHTRGGQ